VSLARSRLETLESGDEAARVSEVLRFARFAIPSDLAVCAAAGVELDRLPVIYAELEQSGRRVALDTSDRRYSAEGVQDLLDRAVRRLRKFHEADPHAPGCRIDTFAGWLERKSVKGLARPLLDRLVRKKAVRTLGQYVCLPEFAPALSNQDEKLLAAMLAEFEAAAFQPPKLSDLQIARNTNVQRLQRLAKIAEATGQLVAIKEGLFLHARRETELRDVVRRLAAAGKGCTVSQIREELNSSRKYVVPLVEYLDRVGFTRRDGDLRTVSEANPS
jgi:selenocysteine-specific elongation factor